MILRLLIVDDDTSLSAHLKTFFERQKYAVMVAHNGVDALQMASEFHPHLMFLDIGLPGLSGIDVLKQVKEKDPSVRVIMITGQTETELIQTARLYGADDYVTKPFTLEYLAGEVLDKLHKQLFMELRTASQDLAIEREKAEVLFENVRDGVILFDGLGQIFMANPAACRMLGLPVPYTLWTAVKVFESFQTPGDRLSHLDREKGEPFDLSREVPKMLVLEGRIQSIFNPNKERFGYLMFFRDVTMERKADTAMHRFISLISHKLRTPLVTIRAYPRLLLTENTMSPLNDFQRNAMQVIAKQCHYMEDMVNQLIAFSSLDPEELLCQSTSVATLVQEAIKFLPDDLKSSVPSIQWDRSLEKLVVSVDPTLMQHAIRNLIENAFKFGATHLEISGQASPEIVSLRFKDDGPGIPSEDRERIFERFYQVEKSFSGQVPGAGLGLTMVRQTLEAHGGKTWVESQSGQGATFCIQLPNGAAVAAPTADPTAQTIKAPVP